MWKVLNKMDKDKLIDILNSVEVEPGVFSDNLAIVLASYFEEHLDRPKDDPTDTDVGWGVWTVEKVNESVEYISEQILKEINK